MYPKYNWNFRQVFGDTCAIEQVQDIDIISSLKFNQDGSFLAAGDRGGRVIIFQRKGLQSKQKIPVEYEFYTEFQAHQTGFDALRSVQISERVIQIQWLPSFNKQLYLLTCNERLVKLWKIEEKNVVQIQTQNTTQFKQPVRSIEQLKFPKIIKQVEKQSTTICRRIFDNVTPYKLNSISVSAEGDRFLISDDLRVTIWDLANSAEGAEVVTLKVPQQDEAGELITYAAYSRVSPNQILYGTSSGRVQISDLRIAPYCIGGTTFQPNIINSAALPYKAFGDQANQADIAAGVCSAIAVPGTNLLLSRDFLSVRIWDVRQSNNQLDIIPLHPQLKDCAGQIVNSADIFDRFEMAVSPDGSSFVTGGYADRFNIISTIRSNNQSKLSSSGYFVQATRSVKKRTKQITQILGSAESPSPAVGAMSFYKDGKLNNDALAFDPIHLKKKIQFLDWHPTENILAIATISNLYIYAHQEPKQ